MSTGGSKASLSGQYLDVNPVVDGTTSVNFKPSGDVLYYIDNDGKLLLSTSYEDIVLIGPGYVDTDDNSILKFGNKTTFDYAKFTVNNFTLVSENASDRWFWCPTDGSVNGTLALGSTAGNGCEKLDAISVAYSD